MEEFDKQFRGYNIIEVNDRIAELKEQLSQQKETIQTLEKEIKNLKRRKDFTYETNNCTRKDKWRNCTFGFKRSKWIDWKSQKKPIWFLKESMEYVRGLSKDMDTFKQEAIDFRKNVVKMSEDMLETIDKSEIFSLIREEKENKYNDGDSL